MKIIYAVISIDDSRSATRWETKQTMRFPELTGVEFVDGRIHGKIVKYIQQNDILVTGQNFHFGELGIWFSNLNVWKAFLDTDADAIIVFEDDALITPDFHGRLSRVLTDLPEDFDFISLHVPENQHGDYYYDREFMEDGSWRMRSSVLRQKYTSQHYMGSRYVATAYQGYGAVTIMYSRAGVLKILDLIEKYGIYTPLDLFLFLENFKRNLAGFTLMPDAPKLLDYEEYGTIARATGMYN